jgi:hypothetical protein
MREPHVVLHRHGALLRREQAAPSRRPKRVGMPVGASPQRKNSKRKFLKFPEDMERGLRCRPGAAPDATQSIVNASS